MTTEEPSNTANEEPSTSGVVQASSFSFET